MLQKCLHCFGPLVWLAATLVLLGLPHFLSEDNPREEVAFTSERHPPTFTHQDEEPRLENDFRPYTTYYDLLANAQDHLYEIPLFQDSMIMNDSIFDPAVAARSLLPRGGCEIEPLSSLQGTPSCYRRESSWVATHMYNSSLSADFMTFPPPGPPPGPSATAPPILVAFLQPPLADPRELALLEFPVDLTTPEYIEWFKIVLQILRHLTRSSHPWMGKDTLVAFTPTHRFDHSPIKLAQSTRALLDWYFDHKGQGPFPTQIGIPRAALIVHYVLNDSLPRAALLDREGFDVASANTDYFYPLWTMANDAGLGVKIVPTFASMHRHLLSEPIHSPHSYYLRRQIAAATLKLTNASRKKVEATGRFIEVFLRAQNTMVLQFHHGYNMYFVASKDRRILPNKCFIAALLCVCAPILMKLDGFLPLKRGSWHHFPAETLFPSPVHKLLSGALSVSALLLLIMSLILICVKFSASQDFLYRHCILNDHKSSETVFAIHRLVLRLSSSLTMLLVMLFTLIIRAYIRQKITAPECSTNKTSRDAPKQRPTSEEIASDNNKAADSVTGPSTTADYAKVCQAAETIERSRQTSSGIKRIAVTSSLNTECQAERSEDDLLYDILSCFSMGLRVTAIVVLGAVAVRSPSLSIIVAPIWGFLGLISVVLCDCSGATILRYCLFVIFCLLAMHNSFIQGILPFIRPMSMLRNVHQEFFSSDLADDLTSRPLGFLSDVLQNSLTSFLCLDSDMFGAATAAATLTMMFIATCLLVAGLRSRKYFEAVMKSRQSDSMAFMQALQECADIIGGDDRAPFEERGGPSSCH